MTDDRWQTLQSLLDAAWELAPAERATYLDAHCQDPALRREAQLLLDADAEADAYFAQLADVAGIASPPQPDAADHAGRLVGHYRLIEPLGRGGMGVVYLAERADGEFEQQVAIKLLALGLAGSEGQRRFLAERQILASLTHPAIARLLDGGVADDGTPYFVMERVRGQPIDRWCDERELPIEARLRLLCEVGTAVEYAHRRLIVHRDIKPANVMVTDDGAPKLLDFGVAKLLSEVEPGFTQSQRAPLTPLWAAPEQIEGGTVTTATDTFALGALAYLLLTGARPYDTEALSPATLMERQNVLPRAPSRRFLALSQDQQTAFARARGTSPPALARRLGGDLDAILMRALDPDPERRYGTAADLVADIERHLSGRPVVAHAPTVAYRVSRFVARHRAAVAAATVITMLLTSLVVVSVQSALSSREQERRVAAERDLAEARRAEAQAVRSFMEDVLLTAQPLVGLGPDATILDGLNAIVARYGDQPISPSPRVDAQVRLAIANVYTRLGRYDEAERLLVRAHEIRLAEFGAQDPEVADTLFELGEVDIGRAEFTRASERIEEAIAIRRNSGVADDPRTGHMLHRLGWALANTGALEKAVEALDQSVAIFRAQGTSTDLADPLNVLATVLRLQGSGGAEAVAREALAIRERDLPPGHTQLGESYNNLAVLLDDLGRRDEAAPLYRRAIEIQQAIYGPDSEVVAASLSNLGILLIDQGKLEEAEQHLRRALDIDRAALGDGHLYVAIDRNNLARSLCRAAKADEGLSEAETALAVLRDQLADDDWRLATTRSVIGLCLWQQGRLDQAEEDLTASLRRLQREFDSDQVNVALARRRVREFYLDTGRPWPADLREADRPAVGNGVTDPDPGTDPR